MKKFQLSPRQLRESLPYKAVHIQCLNEKQEEISGATGSGFIAREEGYLYLYTCWHLVVGYDPHDLRIKMPPSRKYLKISLQDVKEPQPGMMIMEGCQSHTIPLYDFSTTPQTPLWIQEEEELEDLFMNSIGIKVPALHDYVKIRLPMSISTSVFQCIDIPIRQDCSPPMVGDKVFVVGYPYGFSTYGHSQPTAIVLTRFVAATGNHLRANQILLEGFGAPGMSGGPVLIENNGVCILLGLYTGTIFPDHHLEGVSSQITALGSCVNMQDIWIRNSLNS